MGGIAWSQTGANPKSRMLSQTCGRSVPLLEPCLPFKEQKEKEEGNFLASFSLLPNETGFSWLLFSKRDPGAMGSEVRNRVRTFSRLFLGANYSVLNTLSLITAREEMWQVSKHTTTKDGATIVINIRTNTLNVVIYKYRGTGSDNTL